MTRDDGYVARTNITRMVHPIIMEDTVELKLQRIFTVNANNYMISTQREDMQGQIFTKYQQFYL